MSQAQTYAAAGFGQPVPRGTRPAIVVVDFTYGFTDTQYPTAADMRSAISATRQLTDFARAAGVPVIYTTIAYHPGEIGKLPWLKKASGMAAAVSTGPICSGGKLKWICSKLGMMHLSCGWSDRVRIIGSRHLVRKKAPFRGIVTAK
mgnify:CR=1 FL=1